MKNKWTVLGLALILSGLPAYADSAWSVAEIAEIDGFSELEGKLVLAFRNAVTGQPLPGASVELQSVGTAITDERGWAQFPMAKIEKLVDADLLLTVKIPGYIPYEDRLPVRVGSTVAKRHLLSPELAVGQARFVVDWGRRPSDVDAVLTGPGFEVSYRSMQNADGKGRLDRDARQGFGPETITLLEVKPGADYVLSVKNYSKDGPLDGVRVAVYLNNRLDQIVSVPATTAASVEVIRIQNQRATVVAR